jgi:4-hydroxybenzoate polyprenyltransferase
VSDRTDPATPQHSHPRRWSQWSGRIAVERPLPWLVASLVFLVNAVLSATRADWWLAALELATGILAVVSASAVASRNAPPPHR